MINKVKKRIQIMDHLGQYNKYIYDQTQQGHPAYFLKVRMSTPRNQSILAFLPISSMQGPDKDDRYE
jgi:hypothetical protein